MRERVERECGCGAAIYATPSQKDALRGQACFSTALGFSGQTATSLASQGNVACPTHLPVLRMNRGDESCVPGWGRMRFCAVDG